MYTEKKNNTAEKTKNGMREREHRNAHNIGCDLL